MAPGQIIAAIVHLLKAVIAKLVYERIKVALCAVKSPIRQGDMLVESRGDLENPIRFGDVVGIVPDFAAEK